MTTNKHLDPSTGANGSAAPAPPPGAPPWDFAGSVQSDAPPSARAHLRVPDAIERRYLKVGDRYFFTDRTLAFIDDGSRIRVRTENREVMHSVVAIAEARGWRVIELRGTDAFRQGMWREATLRGIEVHGYKPTEVETLQVERALQRGQPMHGASSAPSNQSAEHSEQRNTSPGSGEMAGTRSTPASHTALHAKDTVEDPINTSEPRPLRDGSRPRITGILVAAAAAPYKFDPEQRMSFYVMVRTEVGDRTIWGADLERALAESASQPRIGNQVVLTQHGTNPVNVRVAARNEAGELIGEKKIVAQRARWSIETPDQVRDLQRQGRLLRTGEILAESSLDTYPGLASAAASLKLAEQYARRVTSDAPSQERLLQAIRQRMATAIEQGHSVHLPERKARPDHNPVRQRGGRNREEPIHGRF
jgi:hypothetical protein